ncbi:MAG TPA: radical SAM protein, partial [Candidatus Marinimicrobia bacterium]|nr:radical SAM protein [Candidatus Neomarinimicrobiota bacterium]
WAKRIIFIDLNIIADKDYAAELFEALIPLNLKWYGLSTTLLIKDKQLLKLAAESGCAGLLMGFESITPDNLKTSRKGFNSPEDYGDVTSSLHEHNITLQACFTFGMDHDTPDIFLETAKMAIKMNIDLPRFAIVTPFPGTSLYHRIESEERITTRDWELYDGQHVVFQPRNMTPEELLIGHESAWKYTYSFSGIWKRILGSGIQIPISILANMGYRFYANHLHSYYNCDWITGFKPPISPKKAEAA